MKKLIPLILLAAVFAYMSGACTQLRTPTQPPTETATPNFATATAIAQVTQTCVALQTAGLSAQQTATEQAVIILSQTPTTTPTSFVTPTRTATVTATTHIEHGFRMKTLTAYHDGDMQSQCTFSYGSGATPTAASENYYFQGVYQGYANVVFDSLGNTLSGVRYDENGIVLSSTDGVLTNGLVTRINYRNSLGVLQAYRTYQYNASGLKTREEVFDAAGVSSGYKTWQYNAANKVTWQRDYNGSGAYQGGKETIYNTGGVIIRENGYNGASQLTGYYLYSVDASGHYTGGGVYDGAGAYYGPLTFAYDANWNLTAMNVDVNYGGGNTSSLHVTMTYDANNNMTGLSSTMSGTTSGTPDTPHTFAIIITWEAY